MKATELMIGDWVDTFPEHSQVLSIGKVGRIWTTSQGNYKVVQASGILITPDFWRKNGFSTQCTVENEVDYLFDDVESHCEILAYREGSNWRIKIECIPEASISIKIKYVHQLQHAMRLIGMREIADNLLCH